MSYIEAQKLQSMYDLLVLCECLSENLDRYPDRIPQIVLANMGVLNEIAADTPFAEVIYYLFDSCKALNDLPVDNIQNKDNVWFMFLHNIRMQIQEIDAIFKTGHITTAYP